MGSVLSAPGIGFSNVYTTQKRANLLFGQTGESSKKAGEIAESASDLDDLLDAALDAFVRTEPKPALSQEQAEHSFKEAVKRTLLLLNGRLMEPPKERVDDIKPLKLPVAKQLSDWMATTLTDMGATVAVVARQGGKQHKRYDKTGMLHAGIAMFHPLEKNWKIYNLIDQPHGRWPQCEVQWIDPLNFFCKQGGYGKDALLLTLDQNTQERMRDALLDGSYKDLGFTTRYNLVSAPDSATSLNCNKWVLLNILAAQKENYQPDTLLAEIKKNYRPGEIHVNPFIRLFAAQQPKVLANEVPWWGPIHTVTVESLYHSGLFEKKVFCDPASAEKQNANG
jgi:hypothetical protein